MIGPSSCPLASPIFDDAENQEMFQRKHKANDILRCIRIMWLSRISDEGAGGQVPQWCYEVDEYVQSQLGTNPDMTLDVARM